MVDNIKIDFRTKQITDVELTLKFLLALFDTYEYLKNNEVFITLKKRGINHGTQHTLKLKTNPDKSNINLFKSENNNKTWNSYSIHNYIRLEYVNTQYGGWNSPTFYTKCETNVQFNGFRYDLSYEKLNNIQKSYQKGVNGGEVGRNSIKQFETYLRFIKFLSKNNRKRLINHLYYIDNNKGTEYKKFKTFINGYLGKSLNVTITYDYQKIHRIDLYRSFSEIRHHRLSRILSK